MVAYDESDCVETSEILYKIETQDISCRTLKRMIKNYVINGLELSKEWVEALIIPRLDKMLEKKLNDLFRSRWFDNMLQAALFRMMKEGVHQEYWYTERQPLDKYVKEKVASEVRNMVSRNYEVSVTKRSQ